MSFRCNECGKTVVKVEDIRFCTICGMSGRAASVPAHHDDGDFLTPAIIGYMLGSSFSSHDSPAPTIGDDPAPMTGGGGSFSGAGAGGSWDDSSPSSSSNDSSSSYDSGSSSSYDSGSSSSDSGGSSGGGGD